MQRLLTREACTTTATCLKSTKMFRICGGRAAGKKGKKVGGGGGGKGKQGGGGDSKAPKYQKAGTVKEG